MSNHVGGVNIYGRTSLFTLKTALSLDQILPL